MAQQTAERIQVLDRALSIMDLLMQIKRPMGVNEIAKKLEITPSAAFRILKTLELNGWVFQGEDDKYFPGSKIAFVTEKDNMYMALKEVSIGVMQKLSASEVLPMNLVVRQHQRYFVLQQTRSTRYVDFVPPIGTELPIHASAGGKILLCEMPDLLQKESLDALTFQPMTAHTIINRREFIEELSHVKQQGYALDYYESLDNTCCIGVPIRDNKGEIIAALSFSGITSVESQEQLLYYLPLLQSASKEISKRLYKLDEDYKKVFPDT